MRTRSSFIPILLLIALLAACAGGASQDEGTGYVLTTGLRDGKLVFIGIGGSIDGQVNPVLTAEPGESLVVTLVNGEGAEHDIFFPEVDAKTNRISGLGSSASIHFSAPSRAGTYTYYDSVPGHAAAGMSGFLQVGEVDMAAGMDQQQPSAPATTGRTVSIRLSTGLADGKMVFIQVGGGMDGMLNPEIHADVGDRVEIELTSGEGAEHDISFPDFNAHSDHVVGRGNSVTLSFIADHPGSFPYFCTLAGHRQAGMEGKFIVSGEAVAGYAAPAPAADQPSAAAAPQGPATGANIVRDPTDLPGPIGGRGPTNVRLDLETVEVVGQLADGTTYSYWTFNGEVPGPFFRVRVGDAVEVHLSNPAGSGMSHSVDFHAVTGPGGGAVMTQTPPGGETMFTFMPLNPGLYVYHCATPMVAQHISSGMYGLILVEPAGGLPRVDREFYVMQGEIYTTEPFGTQGHLTADTQKLLDEHPEYFILNGAVGALTTTSPLHASVGETVRIFFGVGGPNFTSSFHVIGEIFDRVYDQASLTSPPLTDVQTTLVPPGGAVMVEFKVQVPGRYILVDHALSRLQRGLAGYLIVDGPDAPEIFFGTSSDSGGH